MLTAIPDDRAMVRCMVVLVAVGLGVSACQQSTLRLAFKYGEIRGRIGSNGMRFVIMPDPTTQLVEVDVRYEVGSRDDPPGKAGLAHLVEHLMFLQRPDGAGSRSLAQSMRQMTLQVNAYTTQDATHFMLNARADRTDALIQLEAMRMSHGCKTISEDEFLREREVVRNEVRELNRSADGLIPQLTLSAIYPRGHAYAQPIGGDDEQLSTITLRDACEFIENYYVPERAIMIVAGGITVDDTLPKIHHAFQIIARRAPAPRRSVERATVSNERRTFELAIERPWVTVAWSLPDARTREGDMARFGIWKLFEAAKKDDEFRCARQALPMILGGVEAPVFAMAFELDDTSKLDDCISRVWTLARAAGDRFRRGSLGDAATIANRRKVAFFSSLESLFGVGSRSDTVGDLVQFSLDVDFDSHDAYVLRELAKLGELSVATLASVVTRTLDPSRARVTAFTASKDGMRGDRRSSVTFQSPPHDVAETTGIEPREGHRPLQIPTEHKLFSGATRFMLDNGMRVVLLPVDAMPVVTLQLIIDGGDATTPDNSAVPFAAAHLLVPSDGGTSYAATGVDVQVNVLYDHIMWTFRGLNVYLDAMVTVLERAVAAGTYKEVTIEQFRRVVGAALEPRRAQRQVEFEHQQLAALFGVDHPYTRAAAYGPRSIAAITSNMLASYRDRHFTAANATLVVAGAFDPKLAESLIRARFTPWRKGAKNDAIPRAQPHRTGPRYVGVIGEDDLQVDVAIGYPSPAGISGQQAARMVLTEMLNDHMWNVRSRLGATYDPRASRDARIGASAYRLAATVDAQRAGEALRAMREGIDALRDGIDFDIMFARARRKVVDRLLGESMMSANLAFQLGEIARFDLEPGHYKTLLKHAAALSIAEVKALLARELDPSTEVVVLLGDRISVTTAFSDAGLASVELVEPDDKDRRPAQR
jgi:zinc protease